MDKVKIDHATWTAIDEECKRIAAHLLSGHALPADFNVSFEELRSEAYWQATHLISNYKSGPLSLLSYVKQWCELKVINAVWSEYKKLEHISLEQLFKELDGKETTKQYVEKHEVKEGEVQSLSVDERSSQEMHDKVDHIMSKLSFIDRKIAELHGRDGHSLEETAKLIGMSRQAVHKRWDKICVMGWRSRNEV